MYVTSTTQSIQGSWTVSYRQQPEPKPEYVPSVEKDVLDDLTLAWWRLRGLANDCDDEGRLSRSVESKLDRAGWLGMTITNMSDYEHKQIAAWVKSKGRDRVYLSKRDWDCGDEPWVRHFIGSYKDYCVAVWVTTEGLMEEFIELLNSFPQRTSALLVKNPAAAMQFIRGTNYKIIKGDMMTAIGISGDIDPVDATLLRLAAA